MLCFIDPFPIMVEGFKIDGITLFEIRKTYHRTPWIICQPLNQLLLRNAKKKITIFYFFLLTWFYFRNICPILFFLYLFDFCWFQSIWNNGKETLMIFEFLNFWLFSIWIPVSIQKRIKSMKERNRWSKEKKMEILCTFYLFNWY